LSSSLKKDTLDFDDDDEFDLDNSDDLNRFINKYESLIISKEKSGEKNIKTPTSATKKIK
jgi:hypothetical protein